MGRHPQTAAPRKGLDWAGSKLIKDDVVEATANLKEDDGPEHRGLGKSEVLRTLLATGMMTSSDCGYFP